MYVSNMGLGFFYNGRNQHELAEKLFRRALQGIDANKDPIAVFNAYLSLAQSLSFKHPAEAMGDWKHAYQSLQLKDSLELTDEREALEIHMMDMSHDIDLLESEQEKAEIRRIQLIIVGRRCPYTD